MEKTEVKCEICDSDYDEEYYKYNDKIYCFDCLVEALEEDKRLIKVETTYYYNEDWGELGTSDDINEVIQNICEEFDIEELKS